VLIVWGARTNRRWVVPVGAMLALPALWYGGLSIMVATLPLLGARSWSDVLRVAAQGRAELAAEVGSARRLFGRRPEGGSIPGAR